MLAREQEDRDGAERDDKRLYDEQELRAGPEPPERREEHEDRIDMRGQPRDLVAVQVRHPQRMSVCRRPDGLHHVPEVEASRRIGVVTEGRQGGEAGGIRGDACREQHARAGQQGNSSHTSLSMISRQRRPRTASLA